MFNIKEKIRKINFQGLEIGGDSSFSFMKENHNTASTLFALELPFFYDENAAPVLKTQYGENYDILSQIERFESLENDLLSIKFNLSEEEFEEQIALVKNVLPQIFSLTKKPLILRGANNREVDKKLLPVLAQTAKRQVIISFLQEETYETVLPAVIQGGHIAVIRTPIDINLVKEMNILTSEKGLDLNRIIIDPDMGGLGYGLDYGYSIIEKLKQVVFDGDSMLNMPIIAFIGEESFKAKEAKSPNYDKNWGEYEKRALMWELAGASAIISAGANIVVLWHADSVRILKGLAG